MSSASSKQSFATALSLRYYINVHTWTILRNAPGSYAIGNGKYGWTFDSTGAPRNNYVLGLVYGDYWDCAWTAVGNVTYKGGPPNDLCISWYNPSPPIENFASLLNCSGCNGGTPVSMVSDAQEYANYGQFSGPYDPLRSQYSGHCVEWRWISLDGSMVMVKDRSYADNDGSWVFIPRSALPATLPGGYGGACP